MKTANNKIPVSSVFHDSEGLYRTHLKGAWPNVRKESKYSREIKKATISEFSTFLKIN